VFGAKLAHQVCRLGWKGWWSAPHRDGRALLLRECYFNGAVEQILPMRPSFSTVLGISTSFASCSRNALMDLVTVS
jgi:hypothetical protein